jgi:hypothetical protein
MSIVSEHVIVLYRVLQFHAPYLRRRYGDFARSRCRNKHTFKMTIRFTFVLS